MNQMWAGFFLTIGTVVFCTGVVYGKLIGEIKLIKYRLAAIEGALKPLGIKFPDSNQQAGV